MIKVTIQILILLIGFVACQQNSNNDLTIFSDALLNEDINSLEEVLRRGKLKIDSIKVDGKSPLEVAMEKENLVLIEVLLKYGNTPNFEKIDKDLLLRATQIEKMSNLFSEYGAKIPNNNTAIDQALSLKNTNPIREKKAVPAPRKKTRTTKYICNYGTPCKVKVLAFGTKQVKIQFLEPCDYSEKFRDKIISNVVDNLLKEEKTEFSFFQFTGTRKGRLSSMFDRSLKHRLPRNEYYEGDIEWTTYKIYEKLPNCTDKTKVNTLVKGIIKVYKES